MRASSGRFAVEDGSEKGLGRRLQRLNAGAYDFGGLVINEHVMKILKTLYDSALMIVVFELACAHPGVVLVQWAPHIWIGVLNSRQVPGGTQTRPWCRIDLP